MKSKMVDLIHLIRHLIRWLLEIMMQSQVITDAITDYWDLKGNTSGCVMHHPHFIVIVLILFELWGGLIQPLTTRPISVNLLS